MWMALISGVIAIFVEQKNPGRRGGAHFPLVASAR